MTDKGVPESTLFPSTVKEFIVVWDALTAPLTLLVFAEAFPEVETQPYSVMQRESRMLQSDESI